VRLAVDSGAGRLVVDRDRKLPGRGAYVHPRPGCVEAAGKAGLARSLRRAVAPDDIRRIVVEMSLTYDNSRGRSDDRRQNAPGLDAAEAVETPRRTQATDMVASRAGLARSKDDRSEDARL